MSALTKLDYAVMDVLMDGPETQSNIALELGVMPVTVRKAILKLTEAGYVTSKEFHREGSGFWSTKVFELVRTKKAA